MKRHLHVWAEEGRVYTRPPMEVEAQRISEALLRQVTFGVTSVRLRCESCRDVKESLLTGDHRETAS